MSLSSLAACASILGDFDVATTNDTTVDGSTGTDGAANSDGSATGNDGSVVAEGGGGDSGLLTDSGPVSNAPIAMSVATSLNATCATVRYPAKQKLVTYCWGERGTSRPEGLGVGQMDVAVNGFHRPKLANTSTYVVFESLFGGGTGDYFLGHSTIASLGNDYAWGDNTNGQCAIASAMAPAASQPTPIKLGTATAASTVLSPGPGMGCVIAGTGPWCWGQNNECQVTFGTTQAKCAAETPIQRAPISEAAILGPSGIVVDKVVSGVGHACAARHQGSGNDTPMDFVCWGDNTLAQDGQGPTQVVTGTKFYGAPQEVNGTINVTLGSFEIAAGDNHTCVVNTTTSKGAVTCWGNNASGQSDPGVVGSGTANGVGPQSVNLPNGLKQGTLSHLALGGDLSCVVYDPPSNLTHSKLYCWGSGQRGTTSMDLVAQTDTIQDVTQVAIGKTHTCAIAKENATDDPGVYCWGLDAQGQVLPYESTSTAHTTPVRVVFPDEPADD